MWYLRREVPKCGKKGHKVASCTVKLCCGCNGRGHAADVCPTSKEDPVMAVASEIGARDDDQEKGTAQASAFNAEETCKCSDGSGEEESAWQVGYEAWICDSGASIHMMALSRLHDQPSRMPPKLRIADGST